VTTDTMTTGTMTTGSVVGAPAANPGERAACARSHDLPRSRRVALSRLAQQVGRPVKKYSRLPVRVFCVLIDGDNDRLDVLVAPVLSGSEAARLF
jgi:hypothetical protein